MASAWSGTVGLWAAIAYRQILGCPEREEGGRKNKNTEGEGRE